MEDVQNGCRDGRGRRTEDGQEIVAWMMLEDALNDSIACCACA